MDNHDKLARGTAGVLAHDLFYALDAADCAHEPIPAADCEACVKEHAFGLLSAALRMAAQQERERCAVKTDAMALGIAEKAKAAAESGERAVAEIWLELVGLFQDASAAIRKEPTA